jgi:SOS-response transcriptional repressor LexA
MENDNRMPDFILLGKFAELYQVSTDYIVGREVIRETPDRLYTASTQSIESIPVPIYEAVKVDPSGNVYYDHFQGYRIVAREEAASGQYFYLVLRDHRLEEEKIPLGSKVLIKQQHSIESGKLYLVVDGTQVEWRRIYHHQDDLLIVQPVSRDSAPSIQRGQELKIVGQAVHFVRDL